MTVVEKSSPRIVFLGTPDFAVESLKQLIEHQYNVVAVVTAPNKPAGRGQQIHMSDVKKYALSQDLPILQPNSLKNPDFIEELRSYRADLQVVVAFRMLPEIVWAMPKMGTINVHGSLLPKYRGAAPINWAIIHGEKVTGVSTFLLKHQIDTGDVLLQKEVPILYEDNFGTLYDKMKIAGGQLLIETLDQYFNHKIQPISQDESLVCHAPKIFKDMCQINFDQPTESVRNFIRGLAPKPGAYTFIHGKTYKIHESECILEAHSFPMGQLITDNKEFLRFACQDGLLDVKIGQLEGKKAMAVQDFLRGYKVNNDSTKAQ